MKHNGQLFGLLALLAVMSAAIVLAVRFSCEGWFGPPELEYPATIELGEQEREAVIIARFVIANQGARRLFINQFSTSCSCAGVEQQQVDGKWERVEAIEVPARGQVQLGVRISIGMPEGNQQRVQVYFSSNDPVRPTGHIELIVRNVKGGVYPVPSAVMFGEIRIGTNSTRMVDLYDNHLTCRRIEKVISLQPERFHVRLIPLDESANPAIHERGGRIIGRLEVSARTTEKGPLSGTIQVSLAGEGRPPDLIRVFGEVVGDIENAPSVMILPRVTGKKVVYDGQVVLRHREGHQFEAEVISAPPELIASIRRLPTDQDRWVLHVQDNRRNRHVTLDKVINIRCRANNIDQMLKIPIVLTSEPNSDVQFEKRGDGP